MAKLNDNKLVMIQSNQTIRVTSGLQYEDFTKKDSDLPNRMKVAPKWQGSMVLIEKGQHTYPAEIATWHTVLSLQDKGVLTIGTIIDKGGNGAEAKKTETTRGRKSLSDIAGE